MSRNRLSLLRAINKMASTNKVPQVQPQNHDQKGFEKRSLVLSLGIAAVVVGYYYTTFVDKQPKLTKQAQITLKENEELSVIEGKELLTKMYKK